jgi:excisionase family DNA binding protein
MEPILLSKIEAAHVLGVSVRTLEHLISRKELTTRLVGRRRMIPRVALEQFSRRDHAAVPQGTKNHER